MSLREKINKQFNTALKSQNRTLVSTLRLVLAAIKERDIANRTSRKKEEVKDQEIIKVLQKKLVGKGLKISKIHFLLVVKIGYTV